MRDWIYIYTSTDMSAAVYVFFLSICCMIEILLGCDHTDLHLDWTESIIGNILYITKKILQLIQLALMPLKLVLSAVLFSLVARFVVHTSSKSHFNFHILSLFV